MDSTIVVALLVLNALTLAVTGVGLWMSWETRQRWVGLLVALRQARRR